jgi:peptidoglycan/xylan/chitin deacetylase (PgdA/CDA1 family)
MITLSVDDGCASDIRVADLANRYEIPTVFYWPVEWHSLAYDKGYTPLNVLAAIEIAKQFEIGSHTITHRHLTNLSETDAANEIVGSKFLLQRMFKQPINRFCPPRGYSNQALTDTVLRHYESQRLTTGKGLVHIHPSSGANNETPWRDYFKLVKERDGDVELWCHSWELNKYNLWAELEEFLRDERTYS